MGRLCQLSALVIVIFLTPVHWGWGIQGIYGQVGSKTLTWKVPAMYVFGDSTVDSGNNNRLYTFSRSNYPPYGRDFDTRLATGRFTNGRMTSDWITEFLRIPISPAYLSPEAQMYRFQGANFASAGAGILNRTGRVLGQILTGWQQIELFLLKRNELIVDLGERAAARHLGTSLFLFSTGGNDYIHSWIINDTDSARLPRDQFTKVLLTTFKNQLQMLYDAGARKVAVLSVGPVGCAPHFLWLSRTTTAECMEGVNHYISEFNDALRMMLVLFNEQNQGAHFLYRDIMSIVYRMCKFPSEFGFQNGDTACCGAGKYGGADTCRNPLLVCENPSDYVWWDEYHPSHRANYFIARQVFSGLDLPTGSSTHSSTSNATSSVLTVEELAALEHEADIA